MSTLFTPLTIRGIEMRNRLWVSPMCQYSAVNASRTTGTTCTSPSSPPGAPAS